MKPCEWCGNQKASACQSAVYWELPDGTRAIEITDTPAFACSSCGMTYQEEAVIGEIENQLFLVDAKKITGNTHISRADADRTDIETELF